MEIFSAPDGPCAHTDSKAYGGSPAFQIGTPSAVISVRGTKFDVEVDRRGFTEVDVDEGVVELEAVTGRGQSVLITAGFSSRVGMEAARKLPDPHRICVRSLTAPAATTTVVRRPTMTIPSRACAPLISATLATTMAAAIQTAAAIPPVQGTATILDPDPDRVLVLALMADLDLDGGAAITIITVANLQSSSEACAHLPIMLPSDRARRYS